jgi:hypothetical protein
MKALKTGLLTTAFLIGTLSSAATEDPVNVRLSASVATAPATVVVTATVVRDERNRMLVLAAESDDFFRSSAIELNGENEARRHQLWLKELPEGHYVISAELQGTTGVRALGTAFLEVRGASGNHDK